MFKWMQRYVSARERATLVDALLAVQIALVGLRAVGWVVVGLGWPGELARTAARGAQVSQPFVWVLFAATAVAFVAWLYRAAANLPALGAEGCLMPELAWLVLVSPVLSVLVFPRVVWRVWMASDPTPPPARRVHAWMAAWWPPLLASLTIACVGLPRSWRLPHEDAGWLALGEGLRVLAAVACAAIVRDVQRRQDEQWNDRERQRTVPEPATDRLR
jgi:hypothetical protein